MQQPTISIHKSEENGQFFSRLVDERGDVIAASSETYEDLGDCLEAAYYFKGQAEEAPVNNRENDEAGRLADYEFEIYRDGSAEHAWRWRFQAPNNEITFKGPDAFDSEPEVSQAIADVKDLLCSAPVTVATGDVIDVGACTDRGHRSPKGHRYRIRVDRSTYVVEQSAPTGREILQVAGKTPTESFQLYQKLRGQKSKPIGLEETVDLTEPGVERFQTMPKSVRDGGCISVEGQSHE